MRQINDNTRHSAPVTARVAGAAALVRVLFIPVGLVLNRSDSHHKEAWGEFLAPIVGLDFFVFDGLNGVLVALAVWGSFAVAVFWAGSAIYLGGKDRPHVRAVEVATWASLTIFMLILALAAYDITTSEERLA